MNANETTENEKENNIPYWMKMLKEMRKSTDMAQLLVLTNIILIILLSLVVIIGYPKLKNTVSFIRNSNNSIGTTSTSISTSTSIETSTIAPASKCKLTSAKLYYNPECPYCQRQLTDGSIDALESSGVSVEVIDVTKGNYSFIQYVPTWILGDKNDEIYTGFKTWEQLRVMFQCS